MIKILKKFPVVLTKDTKFAESVEEKVRAGTIMVLPEDAILVSMDEESESEK